MIEVAVKSAAGEVVRQLQLDERVWGLTPNTAVLHQAVVAQLANRRKGTHKVKTRGEVAGGGRKPWRQKGTGRARQGSTRAPHWRGGGIVFGPKPRSYHKDLPRKMRRLALRSALSAKVQDGELIVVDSLGLETPKTREMVAFLDRLGATGSALVVLGGPDDGVKRAAANLPKIRTAMPGSTNLVDVLNHRWLLMTVDAVETITRTLSADLREPSADGASATRRAAAATAAPASASATATPTSAASVSASTTAAPASEAPTASSAPAASTAPATEAPSTAPTPPPSGSSTPPASASGQETTP
jgi:large subunit ribosomal protein L4